MLYNDDMRIHLDPEIYEQVKNGTKNVEARVNDEKRRQLKVGEYLQIINRANEEDVIYGQVTGLQYFSSFEELADNYPIERLYSPEFTKEEYLALFPQFYSDEEIRDNGVVAIEFQTAAIVIKNPLKAHPDDPDIKRFKKKHIFWRILQIAIFIFILGMMIMPHIWKLLR